MHDLDVLTPGSQNAIKGKISGQSELVKVIQAKKKKKTQVGERRS